MSYKFSHSSAPVRECKNVEFGIVSLDEIKQMFVLSASDAWEILERITDETCRLFSLNPENARPQWMIITVLSVPPPCVCLRVSMEHNRSGEDDLTHMLNHIVRFSDFIEKMKIAPRIKSISACLKGKEGRIRGNLMGKCVDLCARSVIAGELYISIEEVGVPKSIAFDLTSPETVNALNIEKMQKLLGARFSISGVDRKGFDSKKLIVEPRVKIGDTLERHMIDGDYVIFNRQPTLHKMSMMAQKIQTTRVELETLMTVSKNHMSSQASKLDNALTQDALCGIRKMTERNTFISKQDIMDMTGKQIILTILPRIDLSGYHYLHTEKKESFEKKPHPIAEKHEFEKLSPWDTNVLIEDGGLVSGLICKKTVGASARGIVHISYNDNGSNAAREFIVDTAQVVNYWLLHNGFSVGLADAIISPSTQKDIKDTIQKQCKKVSAMNQMFSNGRIIPRGSLSIDKTKENYVQDFLAKARDVSGKLANESLPKFKDIKQMVEAGSTGSILNICQISSNVGILSNFIKRTLSSFSKFDDSPESRGFQHKSSETQELFFHAMGGREGVIDTAVKIAETGYVQRRLVKALEDLIVKYDRTSEWVVLQLHRKFLRDTMRIYEDSWPLLPNIKGVITCAGKIHPWKMVHWHKILKIFSIVFFLSI
ncbi:hypothetical protein BDK51DRAFT_36328 [Blyttiomyces helicus]|uniref:DNA-directed RNA polymerase subunit n=1 Tax=Blyttiomyces helicus TaxID=388810 RepID=A0A4P9WRG7_9FUNG|nr:hypothetical protein BDK51DRAFT_36328 [Blyttiomyces helicus]|eukprot:RKO94783.1 hypothetical protein BDK51DRAFT_36328 [Blyttiomyces helicus]